MLTDDLRQRLQAIFDRVEGGSTEDMETMLDNAIEEGEITQQEARENEMDIAHFFDAHWFVCVRCGWTLPISEMSPVEHDELICSDCLPEEDE